MIYLKAIYKTLKYDRLNRRWAKAEWLKEIGLTPPPHPSIREQYEGWIKVIHGQKLRDRRLGK